MQGYHNNGFFSPKELECKSSGELRLHSGFLDSLIILRKDYGKPMTVTSCCRTKRHNDAINGHPRSLHLTHNEHHNCATMAIDVARPSGVDLAALVQKALEQQWTVGIADTFIHLDRRVDLGMKPRVYTY